MSTSDQRNGAHILVFPYPAMGHIIPLLDLTHMFLTRGLTVTVLITPPHLSLLDPLLSSHPSASIQPLLLSPPNIIPTIDSQLYRPVANARALSALCNPIIKWFKSHPSPPVAIISDIFLGWTHHLASHLGIPHVAFWTSGAFAASVFHTLWRDLPKVDDPTDEDAVLSMPKVPNSPKYPWWQITSLYRGFKEGDPDWEFFRNGILANGQSWGTVFNSFTELEQVYIEHIKKEMGHDRVWGVGPLLPVDEDSIGPTNRGGSSSVLAHDVMCWLDSKANDSVVYVCFGSRWTLTNEQIGVAVRFCECGTRMVPDSSELARLLAESVGGTRLERSRVMEVRIAASEAIKGGSSSRDMEALVNKLCGLNNQRSP
ncbi:hypothetical protein RHMOL_Rhmol03G0046700 [Rhododendron molle]|uniref:Uncharacterized protein n=1 Tax=Rhododendron molle TaxID=49168 RepID=A0ACC0PA72_RHOML|nr:hypothetical protein RHMOL_Rhmol03G0046700 [Rhododendron molle]